jgi:hypothetical protein
MLQYTKGTLKTALQDWNTNSDPTFVAHLDEIIRRGEIMLDRVLDLNNQEESSQTTTAATVAEVWKPADLINEKLVVITVAGVTKQLRKRSRAWIELYNQDGTLGVPLYYMEFDALRWFVAPIPDAAYLITVHGNHLIESLADGSDGTTTWYSTFTPEALYYACSVEACEFLKNYAKKAQNEQDLVKRGSAFIAQSKKLKYDDAEEMVKQRLAAPQG